MSDNGDNSSVPKQAILKSIWESGCILELLKTEVSNEGIDTWIKARFDFCMGLINDKSWPHPGHESTKKTKDYSDDIQEKITSLKVVSKKEYKPGKFRYIFQDVDGDWYSSFHASHFDTGNEAKNESLIVKILFTTRMYEGKLQRNLVSIGLDQ